MIKNKIKITDTQVLNEVIKAIELAKSILTKGIIKEDFNDSFLEYYNYPQSIFFSYSCITLARILPGDSKELARYISILKESYDKSSKSWNSSPLATARAIYSLSKFGEVPKNQLRNSVNFIIKNVKTNGTWKGELPDASNPEGESRYCTSEILFYLNTFECLPEKIKSKGVSSLKNFFFNIQDNQLHSEHTAYTVLPLYNLFMMGEITFEESPFDDFLLRFLIDLEFYRNSRERQDTVLETVYILKLLLRTGLSLSNRKITNTIKWLLEVRMDNGWNMKAYDPPSPYVTAKVIDVLCDYIAFHSLQREMTKHLTSFLPSSSDVNNKSSLVKIWEAVDWKFTIPLIGLSLDLKKLLKANKSLN